MLKKSLKSQNHLYSDPEAQLEVLNNTIEPFSEKIKESGFYPLRARNVEIFQVNIGKMCNQTCKHCHVDAGPDRKEIMTRETMQECLKAISHSSIETVDITGGAPEMNPDFKWFVEEISKIGKKIIVRCNLTIIVANPKYHYLPEFYRKHKVEVVSSLPYFARSRTDAQRGNGVFDQSIQALKMLNEVGYGKDNTGLILNLVYNPTGAFLPPGQNSLERDFKRSLKENFDIDFNNLFAITNMPVSRFLDYLIQSENFETYMEKLLEAFNPAAVENVMCRNTISVGWDGYLFDCDFNQMLDLKVKGQSKHVRDFNADELSNREIVIKQHCYGCTAGAGSSCGGEVV